MFKICAKIYTATNKLGQPLAINLRRYSIDGEKIEENLGKTILIIVITAKNLVRLIYFNIRSKGPLEGPILFRYTFLECTHM